MFLDFLCLINTIRNGKGHCLKLLDINLLLFLAGSDYFEVTELFNFTASVTSQVLSSVLIEDDVVEQRESFILKLEVLNQDRISVQLILDQAVITIVDADGKEV